MAVSKLDQTGDLAALDLHRFSKLYNLPDYVKQAAVDEAKNPTELPTAAYADIRTPPQFPCHTKSATYLSWVYFLEKRAELNPKVSPRIEERLQHFANDWGIANDVAQLKTKWAEVNNDSFESLPDHKFAFVWASEDGRKERRYPLRNGLEVKAAADWFSEYRDEFVFADRHTIANKILDRAGDYGVNLGEHDDMLQKQAGRGFCHPKQASDLIRMRVKAANRVTRDVADEMEKLADVVSALTDTTLDSTTAFNLANTIDRFDRSYGVKHSAVTPRVEDSVYAVTQKSATDVVASGVELMSGSVYEQHQFNKLALHDIRDMFGDEIAEEVRNGLNVDPMKMAEVAATFPRPDAARLDQLMSEVGMRPIAKQAAHTVNWQREQLLQMAELYS